MAITTTHDPLGGGRPRLIFSLGHDTQTSVAQREFDLLPGITHIGSHADAHLRLSGIDEHHAEIRRDEEDEYVYHHTGFFTRSRVDGRSGSPVILRTGSRIQLGGWTLSYFRDEFADHGRPYGGRLGGSEEGSLQRGQLTPRPRGTSVGGGSQGDELDGGEYF